MADKNPTMYQISYREMYQISYREMILMRIELIGVGLAFGMFAILKAAKTELLGTFLSLNISDGGHRVILSNISLQILFIGICFTVLTHRRFKRIKRRAIKETT